MDEYTGNQICIKCHRKIEGGYCYCYGEEQIVTTIHQDRQYENCLCCVCNTISKCTPSNDFYSTKDHGEGIICEKCCLEYLEHKLKGGANG